MTGGGWARLGGNLPAAYLIGEGLMVALRPRRQTFLSDVADRGTASCQLQPTAR